MTINKDEDFEQLYNEFQGLGNKNPGLNTAANTKPRMGLGSDLVETKPQMDFEKSWNEFQDVKKPYGDDTLGEGSESSILRRGLINPIKAAGLSMAQGVGGIMQSAGDSLSDTRQPARRWMDAYGMKDVKLPDVMEKLVKPSNIAVKAGQFIAGKGENLASAMQERIQQLAPPGDASYAEQIGFKVLHNLGLNAPGLAMSLITKKPMYGLGYLGANAYGTKYAAERKMGATPEQAHQRGLSVAGSEIGTEFLPISILLKPGLKFGARVVYNLLSELVGENVNTAYEMMQDRANHDPDKPFGDFVTQDLLPAFGETSVVAGLSSLAMGAAAHPFTIGLESQGTKINQSNKEEIPKEIKTSYDEVFNQVKQYADSGKLSTQQIQAYADKYKDTAPELSKQINDYLLQKQGGKADDTQGQKGVDGGKPQGGESGGSVQVGGTGEGEIKASGVLQTQKAVVTTPAEEPKQSAEKNVSRGIVTKPLMQPEKSGQNIPRGIIPAQERWDKTPMDARGERDDASEYLRNLHDKTKEQVDALKEKLSSIKGKGSKEQKAEINKQIKALAEPYNKLRNQYEENAWNEGLAFKEDVMKRAREAGITDEEALDNFADDLMMGASDERPYIEHNYNKPVKQIFDEVLQRYLAEKEEGKSAEVPQTATTPTTKDVVTEKPSPATSEKDALSKALSLQKIAYGLKPKNSLDRLLNARKIMDDAGIDKNMELYRENERLIQHYKDKLGIKADIVPKQPAPTAQGEGLASAMQMVGAIKNAHLIKNPAGSYSFVGKPDVKLLLQMADGSDVPAEILEERQKAQSPRMTDEAYGIKLRLFKTPEEAITYAKSRGLEDTIQNKESFQTSKEIVPSPEETAHAREGTSQAAKEPSSGGVAPAVSKEPWQMNQIEYQKYIEDSGMPSKMFLTHKEEVQRALSTGEPVPLEVLKDYPDLQQPHVPSVQGDRASQETPKPATPQNTLASIDDIPYRVAYDAHRGTSFSPEKRAKQIQEDYVQTIEGTYREVSQYATTEQSKQLLDEEIERFRKAYKDKYIQYLAVKSRIISPMIAGPSKFPTARMKKLNDIESKRLNELLEWKKKAENGIIKKLKGQTTEEAGGEVEVLKQKIEKAKKLQDVMKQANAIIRKKISDAEKIAEMEKVGIKEKQARELLQPDFAGRLGFADYQLTNNNANIKRMESRVGELEKKEATPTQEIEYDKGSVVDNNEADRIQILFHDRPNEVTRSKLKQNGFKWSPNFGAWQRQRTTAGQQAVDRMITEMGWKKVSEKEGFEQQPEPVIEKPKAQEVKAEKPNDVVIESHSEVSQYPDLREITIKTLQDEQNKGNPAVAMGTTIITKDGRFEIENGKLVKKHDLSEGGFKITLPSYYDATGKYGSYNKAAKEYFEKVDKEKEIQRIEFERIQKEKREQESAEQEAVIQRTNLIDDEFKKAKFKNKTIDVRVESEGKETTQKISGSSIGGLLAHKTPGDTTYTITHIKSGFMLIEGFSSLKQAKMAAYRLSKAYNFDVDKNVIEKDIDIVRPIVLALRADVYADIENLQTKEPGIAEPTATELAPEVTQEAAKQTKGVLPEIVSETVGHYKTGVTHIKYADDAAQIAYHLTDNAQENMISILTDKNDKVLSVYRHTIGLASQSQADYKLLAGQALNTEGAAKMWLAHNHPGGESALSEQDKNFFLKTANLMKGTGVSLQDIIAVTPTSYSSILLKRGNIVLMSANNTVQIKERKFKTHPKGLVSTTSHNELVDYAKTAFPEGGIILVNNKNSPVAHIKVDNYANLRGKVQENILREVDKRNAAAMFVYEPHRAISDKALDNVMSFAKASNLQVIDMLDSTNLGGINNPKKLEAIRETSTINFESGGFQTIYESIENAWKERKIQDAFNSLVEAGNKMYEQGVTNYDRYINSMKTFLGKMYESFKHMMARVWRAMQESRLVREETGAVGDLNNIDALKQKLDAMPTDEIPEELARQETGALRKLAKSMRIPFSATTSRDSLIDKIHKLGYANPRGYDLLGGGGGIAEESAEYGKDDGYEAIIKELDGMVERAKKEARKPKDEQNQKVIQKGKDIKDAQEWFDKEQVPTVLSTLKNMRKNWGKNRKAGKPDTTIIGRIVGSPEFTFEKVPALKKVLEASLQYPDDAEALFNDITERKDTEVAGKGGKKRLVKESLLTPIVTFEKQNPKEYERWSKFIISRDINKTSWTPEEMQANGFSEQAVESAKAYKGIVKNAFNVLTSDWRKTIEAAEKAGLPIPEVVTRGKDGKDIVVSLKTALETMGDATGWYFPRMRKSGRIQIIGKGDGVNPEIEFRDSMVQAEYLASQMRQRGLEVSIKESKNMPEDVFNFTNKTMSIQQMFNEALRRMDTKAEDRSLGDFGITGEWGKTSDGKAEYTIRGPMNLEHNEFYKSLGGQFFADTKKTDEKMWHFINPAEDIELKLVQKLNETENYQDQVLLEFSQSLIENLSDIIKARGYRGSMIKRGPEVGVDVWKGYETDVLKAITQYARGLSYGVAKKNSALAMMRAMTGTDVSWQEYQEANPDAEYKDYKGMVEEKRIDATRQKNAYHDGKTYVEEMLRNQEFSDRVIGMAKGITTLKYLAFKVFSSPAVNMSSLVTSTPAAMNGHANIPIHRTFDLMAKGITLYGKYLWGNHNKLSPDIVKFFDEIRHRGWHKAQFNEEALGVLRSKTEGAWRKTIEWGMFTFGLAEQINRVATMAGTYLGMKEQGKSFDESMEMSKHVSDRAHGIYQGKRTLPYWAQGKNPAAMAGKLFYVFSKYSHTYLQSMYELGVNKKQYKAATYMMLAPILLGGMSGVPVWEVLMTVIRKLTDDDPEEGIYDAVEDIANPLGTMARQGIPGLLGYDLRGSLSMNVDLPVNTVDLLGVFGNVLSDVYYGGKNILKGDISRGMEEILPRGAGAVLKGVREYREGVTTHQNTPVFYGNKQLKPDLSEAIMEMLAFQPSRIAKAKEEMYSEKRVEANYGRTKQDIYDRFRKFYLQPAAQRNREGYAGIVQDMKEFNRMIVNKGLSGRVSRITGESVKAMLRRGFRPSKKERRREIEE